MSEAIQWAIRLPTADAAMWRAFTDWLAASPANLAAYEQVAEADRRYEDAAHSAARSPGPSAPLPRDKRQATVWLGGGALAAASVAGALLLWQPPGRDFHVIETTAGVRQSVTLEDGSEIALNGGSRLTLDRNDRRFARLDHGEALFIVADDPDEPFKVEARGTTIRNLGTVFDVRSEADQVAVAVAEGAVRFDAGGQSTRLSAGERAEFSDGTISRGRVDSVDIAGWRDGRLSFSSATLSEVARDISRATGLALSVDPAIAERQFSGTIMVGDDRGAFRRRLGAMLEVEVRLVGDSWILAPAGR